MVPPGKAGGGRERAIWEMLEASLLPAALLSEAGRQWDCWGKERSARAMQALLQGGPPNMAKSSPKISALALGMGESWHCWALAARLWASPFDLLVLIPLQIPIPRQLASQCAAYEMEEIKLQNLRIGRAQRNI